MPGRGPQTLQKRQKEQQRQERRAEKLAKKQQRPHESLPSAADLSDQVPTTSEKEKNPS